MDRAAAEELLNQFVEWLEGNDWAGSIPGGIIDRFLEYAESDELCSECVDWRHGVGGR